LPAQRNADFANSTAAAESANFWNATTQSIAGAYRGNRGVIFEGPTLYHKSETIHFRDVMSTAASTSTMLYGEARAGTSGYAVLARVAVARFEYRLRQKPAPQRYRQTDTTLPAFTATIDPYR